MATQFLTTKSLDEMPKDTRRGGTVQVLLSPKTVGSTTGFMGVATLKPGERISEHYHPYSEEFVYVVSGSIEAQCDDVSYEVGNQQGLVIPIGVRHRLLNTGGQEAQLVFHLCPLAPRPDMGHVDTE
ncbi:MAG TPA: cupin domain-containing protein [Ktedonobacteraceae bacterium]|nr:cupin domain-containing protein [Ktedonobacteraceae bacterium]